MLGKLREIRQRKREEIANRMAIADMFYGRLDGEDAALADLKMIDDLATAEEGEPINDSSLIQLLDMQLKEALAIIADQNEVIAAARELCVAITTVNRVTGDAVFKTVSDDETAITLLNHRYSDLAALLNGTARPVPGKLPQGTVH